MPATEEALQRLTRISNLSISRNVPLHRYTRFGIGGPAAVVAETASEEAFAEALAGVVAAGVPYVVIGGGTNLVVSDEGFDGVVLRFTGARLTCQQGSTLHEIEGTPADYENERATGPSAEHSGHFPSRITAEAGALLDDLVEFAIANGRQGLESLAGIPGSVGGAVYGNAGAYGHSISEFVRSVRFHNGNKTRTFTNPECRFGYRDSIFKYHKGWTIFSTELALPPGEPAELRRTADEIRRIRNRKFPPVMKCAGSVFKNLLLAELPGPLAGKVPDKVVREGKVPAAYFLDQVGARGMARGAIRVADYHANLIYNEGGGTAEDLRALIRELKSCVLSRFGLALEEEVQYVGFPADADDQTE